MIHVTCDLSSALEICIDDDALYKSTYTLLYFTKWLQRLAIVVVVRSCLDRVQLVSVLSGLVVSGCERVSVHQTGSISLSSYVNLDWRNRILLKLI